MFTLAIILTHFLGDCYDQADLNKNKTKYVLTAVITDAVVFLATSKIIDIITGAL